MTPSIKFAGALIAVAPALYRVEGHQWAWVRLSELAKICNSDATTLWRTFCFDAREAPGTPSEERSDWLYAEPVSRDDCFYDVKAAVDHQTGEVACPAEVELVMVPAGWSGKNIVAKSDALRRICATLLDDGNGLFFSGDEFNTLVNGISLQRLKVLIGMLMSLGFHSGFNIECSSPSTDNLVSITISNDVNRVIGVFRLSLGYLRATGSLTRSAQQSA